MARDALNWPIRMALAIAAAIVPLACLQVAHAQSIMRTPNLQINSRMPSINPTIGPRINTDVGRIPHSSVPRIGVRSTLPEARFSPNLGRACDYANRGGDGECSDRTIQASDGGGKGGKKNKSSAGTSNASRAAVKAVDRHVVSNEIVAELDGTMTQAQADTLARRYGLTRLDSRTFPLLGATIGLFRINDRRPAEVVRRKLAGDGSVRAVHLNYLYFLQDQKAATSEGDPAQYAVAQLRLPQAHALVRGMNVTVAVIDSGIDTQHPELANSIADSFDALGSKEGAHVHGTGVAGAIAAHARLMGSAPEVRILAIRAFSAASSGAQSTSYVILKSLDYAALHGAQIINMSFAGPKDALIERAVAATAARGIVLVAAAGNAGAKSPPLYPAANPNVIAVSGTDAQDRLFTASNRGNYIALAAPGADLFLPAPDGKYQITSGTSFSAALVSGIAALVLERNPALKPNEVRTILTSTARDLGAPGRDDLFGSGKADAFAAVTATASSAPAAVAKDGPPALSAPEGNNTSVKRALGEGAPAMASDKTTANDPKNPAAR